MSWQYLQSSPARASQIKQASRCMHRGLHTFWHEVGGGGKEIKSSCVRLKKSKAFIRVGAVDDEALDLTII